MCNKYNGNTSTNTSTQTQKNYLNIKQFQFDESIPGPPASTVHITCNAYNGNTSTNTNTQTQRQLCQIKQFQFDESIPSTVLSVLLDVGGGWMGGVGEQDLQRGTKIRLCNNTKVQNT